MLTLGQAAREVGKTKTTLANAIKKGRISATKDEQGQYRIDQAELFRVYPQDRQAPDESLRDKTPQETGGLQREIELLREQLAREREFSAELSRRLDEEARERRETQTRLTALLTHQPEPPPAPSNGRGALWEKLFGRRQD
jgi:hypothetical protein